MHRRRQGAGAWATVLGVSLALSLAGAASAEPPGQAAQPGAAAPKPASSQPPAAGAPPSVASEGEGYLVAPFQNQSNVKSLDWMSSALAITVAERLEALPRLRPLYGAAVISGWEPRLDVDKAFSRAREAGARWLITGTYSRPNWKAEVTVRVFQVVDPTPSSLGALKEVTSASVSGDRNALFEVIDQALDKALAQQGWGGDAEVMAALHRRPTRDVYAFTLFGRALNLFYALDGEQNLEQAQKLLLRATFIDPKFAEAHRLLGLVDLERGDEQKAAGQYAYALDLKPSYYPCIVGLARLYRGQDKRQPAREMAERALSARPSDGEMRLLLGTLEWEAGELDKALANLLIVVAAHPKNVIALRTLAQIYSARGEVEALADELVKIAELAPDDLEVKLDLGSAYMRLGKHEKALAAYEDVLRRQPRHVQALKFTGDLYRRVGDPEHAIAAYEKVRHLMPDDPRAYFLLGAAYSEAGNQQKAELMLQEAENFKGYKGEAFTDLGAIALHQGDLQKATWYLARAVVKSPMRPKAHYNYALLLDATNQRDRALGELKTVAELDPEDPECHYLSGVIYLRLGKLLEAKQEFTEALRRKPDHADAKYNLAQLDDMDRRYGAEHSATGAQ